MANTTGEKFGGRQKGVPNKSTQYVIDKAQEIGCDPIEFLCYVIIADVTKLKDAPDLDQRIGAAKELASYMYPKRKAIEHTGADGGEIKIKTIEDFLKSQGNQDEEISSKL